MREIIEQILDTEIRPILKNDGGDIELVEVNEEQGIISLRFLGVCRGCPMAKITFQDIVEKVLKEKVSVIKEIKLID